MIITLLDKDKLLDSIFRVSTLLTADADLSVIQTKILEELLYTLDFDRGMIRFFDSTRRYLEVQVVKNFPLEEEKRAFDLALDVTRHNCLSTFVARSGEIAIVEKAVRDSRITSLDRYITSLAEKGSVICVPLKVGDSVIGTMEAWREEESIFYPEEISIIQAFANQMSIIIQNARLLKAGEEKIRQLTVLQEVVSELNVYSTLDDGILKIVLRGAKEITGADSAIVYFCDLQRDRCMVADENNSVIDARDGFDERMGKSSFLIKEAIESGNFVVKQLPVEIPPMESDTPYFTTRTELAIPFAIRDRFKGALYLSKNKGSFTEDQINALDILVKNAATTYDNAIMNSLLHQEAESLKSELERMKEREDKLLGFQDILGKSEKMLEIFRIIADVAGHNTNILIQGESGTGKELVARAIHRHSPRSNKPFVDVNCAAIPPTLLESELFGYEAGAFTDARKRKIGLLEYANGGTMLLDEIGEMNIQLQAKFLRMLEDGHIRRLGGTEKIPIDVRFIFSTNRDLAEMVSKGTFREDLFYRIRVVPIVIPPLRERPDDIILLANHFVKEFNQKFRKKIRGFDKETERILQDYPWPGNVRELRNIIERVMILKNKGKFITADDLPREIVRGSQSKSDWLIEPLLDQLPFDGIDYKKVTEKILLDIKNRLLQNALIKARGNKSEAARRLGISRFKLIREQKKLAQKLSSDIH
ncbi:MAG: sigma 54-interacting transcriptional regulator [Syntrophales bacterium]|nr:sigma 54-interacting transcriptional regulator [Syntrophales bacterium]